MNIDTGTLLVCSLLAFIAFLIVLQFRSRAPQRHSQPEISRSTKLNSTSSEAEATLHAPTIYIPPANLRPILSAREWEIVALVARGLSNKEIGRQLGISPYTVATHLKKMFRKFNVESRTELATHLQHLVGTSGIPPDMDT